MAKQQNLIHLHLMAAKFISIVLFLLSERLQETVVSSQKSEA